MNRLLWFALAACRAPIAAPLANVTAPTQLAHASDLTWASELAHATTFL